MASRPAVVVAVIAAVLPASAIADRLVDAYLRGDQSEVARLGRHSSAARLEERLVSPDRPTTLSAIAAAPTTDDAWDLLLVLSDLAGGADRPIAQAAAQAAAKIAHHLDADRIANRDIPRDAVQKRRDAWRELASRDDRWADVRVLALEISSRLSRALDPAALGFDLEATLEDADPEMRRAALELLPSPVPDKQLARVARAAKDDPELVVSLVAGQALCSGLALGDPPDPILDALGDEGLGRLRGAIVDPALPIAARADAAFCVAAEGSKASRAAVAKLASTAPPRLRKSIAATAKRQR